LPAFTPSSGDGSTPEFPLDACLRGDQRAWEHFVTRYAGVIRSAVRKAIGASHPDAEDAVQALYARLIRNDCRLLKTFDGSRAKFTTWLTLVARSVAIDHVRRKRRPVELIPEVAAQQPAPAVDPGSTESDPSPLRAFPLHLLTDRQRLVVRLLFEESRSVAETAGIIGVDEQTVRSTKHKALLRLRDRMAPGARNGDAAKPERDE